MLTRPEPTEYAEFYRSYITKIPDGPLLDFLAQQPEQYRKLLSAIPDADAAAPSAPGKWSIKQVLGHVCDTERVISYRALRFARGDAKELPGFEQDDYVREANSNARSLQELLDELAAVRKCTLALFGSLPPGVEMRRGMANGNPVTVRALAYIAAGHCQHHFDLLQGQLETKAAQARIR
jgi:hypothetical protein